MAARKSHSKLQELSGRCYCPKPMPLCNIKRKEARKLGVCFRYVLMAVLLHCPIPCPDLDGECRGVPIESLADANAWHVLLLGVRPNDDIDRGPIRPKDKAPQDDPSQSPFGDHAMVATAHGQSATAELVSCPVVLSADFVAGHLSGSNRLDRFETLDGGPPITPRHSVLRI